MLHKDLKEDQLRAEWVHFQRYSAWQTDTLHVTQCQQCQSTEGIVHM